MEKSPLKVALICETEGRKIIILLKKNTSGRYTFYIS